MARTNYNIRNQVIDLTTNKVRPVVDNLYKESLRAMLHLMGDIYYIDGNSNKVKIRCTHGNPERLASRLVADNTMELPLLSVTEVSTSNSDERRRHNHILISEKEWDPKTRRAIRVVSLAPRPVNITYEINIWTKYKSDMDMIRSSIFSMFNPDVEVRTKYSDYSRAFLVEERDLGSLTANDAEDRIIQKSITISLETYIPSPKFRITSTGEISDFLYEFTLDSDTSREAVEVVEVIGTTPDSGLVIPAPPIPNIDLDIDLGNINLALSDSISIVLRDTQISLGLAELSTGIQGLLYNQNLSLQENNIILSALSLEYTEVAGQTDSEVNLGLINLVTSALGFTLDAGVNAIETVATTTTDIVLAQTVGLDDLSLILSSLDFAYSLVVPGLVDLGILGLGLATPSIRLLQTGILSTESISTTNAITLDQSYAASTIGVTFSQPNLVYNSNLVTEDPNLLLDTSVKYDVGMDFGVYNTDTPDPDF